VARAGWVRRSRFSNVIAEWVYLISPRMGSLMMVMLLDMACDGLWSLVKACDGERWEARGRQVTSRRRALQVSEEQLCSRGWRQEQRLLEVRGR
jgi:hypothetical protein